jgi:aspartate carbamoyltransferase catalytic subunit
MNDIPPRSDLRHLISVDDLSVETVSKLLDLAGDTNQLISIRFPASVALLIFQPSLRTRLGFARAIIRIGGVGHELSDIRSIPNGEATESLNDTLRVAAGMTDLVIVRSAGQLADLSSSFIKPVINAGDDHEHPTQALIDMLAISSLSGRWEELTIGISGDLQMRATRSLLKLISRMPPKAVRLMSPLSRRGDALDLVQSIRERTEWSEQLNLLGLDALYLSGLPPSRGKDVLDPELRTRYALTDNTIDQLPAHARVFSPMPVIDEISAGVRTDARLAIFEQSDLGVNMRIAVLGYVLGHSYFGGSDFKGV